MFAFMRNIRRHHNDEGASAVEYGLLVAAIAAVIVVVVFALGNVLHSKFQDTCTQIGSNAGATTAPADCSK